MPTPISPSSQLREPTFFILLSLAPGDKYGYAILKEVEVLSQGRLHLSTGTLYEALLRLLEQDWIERVDDPESRGEGLPAGRGRPRKVYRLTRAGRQVLDMEVHRLSTLISAANRQLNNNSI